MRSKTKLVFFGAPDFAAQIFGRLLSRVDDYVIELVITYPDKARGRGRRSSPMPVKSVAQAHNIPVLEIEQMDDARVINKLNELQPDMGVVVAFGILPESVFSIPAHGILNVHPSLLPDLRGSTPIQTALLRGYERTGVSIISITREVDAGGIVVQDELSIEKDETRGELEARIVEKAEELLVVAMDRVQTGDYELLSQDESEVTYASKFKRDDYELDFSSSASDVHNKVRAFSPNPGAFSYFRGKRVKVLRTSLVQDGSVTVEPGTIINIDEDKGILAGTGEGVVAVKELKPAGSRLMNFKDFVNGYRVEEGEYFGQ